MNCSSSFSAWAVLVVAALFTVQAVDGAAFQALPSPGAVVATDVKCLMTSVLSLPPPSMHHVKLYWTHLLLFPLLGYDEALIFCRDNMYFNMYPKALHTNSKDNGLLPWLTSFFPCTSVHLGSHQNSFSSVSLVGQSLLWQFQPCCVMLSLLPPDQIGQKNP